MRSIEILHTFVMQKHSRKFFTGVGQIPRLSTESNCLILLLPRGKQLSFQNWRVAQTERLPCNLIKPKKISSSSMTASTPQFDQEKNQRKRNMRPRKKKNRERKGISCSISLFLSLLPIPISSQVFSFPFSSDPGSSFQQFVLACIQKCTVYKQKSKQKISLECQAKFVLKEGSKQLSY